MQRPETTYFADVLTNEMITPHMRRVVFGGPGLADFTSCGIADEWIRLFFPTSAGEPAVLPVSEGKGWSFPDDVPREGRWYSVRRFDPGETRLTIDIVDHEGGVATAWARTAVPGDRIAVSGADGRYGADIPTGWELIVADMTGLPAALRILEEMPAGKKIVAVFEVKSTADQQVVQTSAEVDVHWLIHPEHGSGPSQLAPYVEALEWHPGTPYVWMSAEAAATREIRSYVRRQRRVPNGCADVVGYWSIKRNTR